MATRKLLPRSRTVDTAAPTTEAVRIRNYDGDAAHIVEVRLRTPEGETVLAESCRLGPGDAASAAPSIDPGAYDAAVAVDGEERTLPDCRIDGWPAGTVLVEIGNGVVSLENGPR